MSKFFEELWESVFTPGPTPTLLKAANGSFAALQVVLLALLAATRSIHLVILSFLCAGLWWSINWFAAELKIQQDREERDAARKRRLEAEAVGRGASSSSSSSSDGEGTETEVERSATSLPEPATIPAAGPAVAAGRAGEVRRREAAAPPPGTQSSVSTEDEWEKVSESENDKQK